MRYYDAHGRRVPSPRGERVPLDGYVYVWLMGVIVAMAVMVVVLGIGG